MLSPKCIEIICVMFQISVGSVPVKLFATNDLQQCKLKQIRAESGAFARESQFRHAAKLRGNRSTEAIALQITMMNESA